MSQPTPQQPTVLTPTPAELAAKEREAKADSRTKPEVAASPAATARGFLMRGDLDVSDFDNTWPLIRDKIIALGGKAAGNVELGWLRREDQSYFHFSLPESNYSELELFLGPLVPSGLRVNATPV
ncbi:MAG: hypothetical protein HC902_00590 [Calothrix sp. SM1_5_4]|nr:hypothetical protein [Calothrix sp. SM1_5_4]